MACIIDDTTPQHLENIAAGILYALRSGLAMRERNSVPISCSMGIVRVENTALLLEELSHQADTAMYSVKQDGKGSCRIITI